MKIYIATLHAVLQNSLRVTCLDLERLSVVGSFKSVPIQVDIATFKVEQLCLRLAMVIFFIFSPKLMFAGIVNEPVPKLDQSCVAGQSEHLSSYYRNE